MAKDKQQTLTYLEAICAKREYCRSEVTKKALTALEGDSQAAAEVVESLVRDGFVDDARYASAFAREKASLTGWGPAKIRYSLMLKGIAKPVIAEALGDIDEGAAERRLQKLCEAKWKVLQGDPYAKFKLIKYALSRGYEYDEINKIVDSLCHGFAQD